MTGKILILSMCGCWAGALCWTDIRHRRLPNTLTIGGALAALAARLVVGSRAQLVDGLAGGVLASVVLLVPFLTAAAGGGDLKMLFAAGAAVGYTNVLWLLWYLSLAGLLLAVAMQVAGLTQGARLRHAVRRLFDVTYDARAGRAQLPPRASPSGRVPFGVAISIGLILTLLWHPM